MSPTPAEQVADVISSLAKVAWPVAIVTLLVRYRDLVERLFSNRTIESVGVGPISAKLVAAAQTVEAAASRAGVDESAADYVGIERSLIEELASVEPRAAIAASWGRVRQVAAFAVGRLTDEPPHISTVGKLEQLQAHGFLEPPVVDLGRTLKEMETASMAEGNRELPVEFARTFSVAAISLAGKIGALMKDGYTSYDVSPMHDGSGWIHGGARPPWAYDP